MLNIFDAEIWTDCFDTLIYYQFRPEPTSLSPLYIPGKEISNTSFSVTAF